MVFDNRQARTFREYLVLRMRLAGFRIGHNASKARLKHQSLDSLAIDPIVLPPQGVCHSPAAIEWMPGELLINQFEQFQLFSIYQMDGRFQVVSRAIRTGNFTLTGDRYRLLGADPVSSPLHRDIPDFF